MLDVDPLIFRVLFVVFTPFGGLGLLLYGILWLLVPDEGEENSEAQKLAQGRTSNQSIWAVCAAICGFVLFVAIAASRWDVALWLFVIGLVIYLVAKDRDGARSWRATGSTTAAGGAATTPAPGAGYPSYPHQSGSHAAAATTATIPTVPGGRPPDPPTAGWGYGAPPPQPPRKREPRSPLPWLTLSAALLAAGVLVAIDVADWQSVPSRVVLAIALVIIGAGLMVGTWFGRARSLISTGLIVTVALFIAALRLPLGGGVGKAYYQPRNAAEAQQTHRLGVGKMVLDLRDLDPAGQTVQVDASMGVGQTIVCLPAAVPVEADARVTIGSVNIQADNVHRDGRFYSYRPTGTPIRDGRVELDLNQGIGEIVFTTERGDGCEASFR